MTHPVSAAEFSALMAPLGPFEPAPLVAVAVSGGADSLALALLAAEWARAWGGEAIALTVDHRLRPESSAEAERVAGWLAARGIRHHILSWTGPKPSADLQAAARAARYGLLEEWCAAHGVLHLLLAHHQEDQAETLLLRLGRGSGVDGLSAMAAIEHHRSLRLLRPCLTIPRARLRATLTASGQDWVEDPSNANAAYSRVRLRGLLPKLAAEGLTPGRLAATARRLGRAREALEQATAAAAVAVLDIHPAGFARIDETAWRKLPEEIGLRLLSRVLLAVGGGAYTPRLERLEAVYAAVCGVRTLAGCRIEIRGGVVLVSREAAKMAGPVELTPGRIAEWDGRFRVAVGETAPPGLRLGALGAGGWRAIDAGPRKDLPAVVRPTLPALFDEDGICAVPHLGYNRGPKVREALRWIVPATVNPLTKAGRCLV